VDVKMGESETAMEYDQDLIFKHLCVPYPFIHGVILTEFNVPKNVLPRFP